MANTAMHKVLLYETARGSSSCVFFAVRKGVDCDDRTDWQLNCVKCVNREAFWNCRTMFMCQSTCLHMLRKCDVRLT